MSQVINTNVASLNAQRQLNKSQSSYNTSLERLSSGLRINSAKDDAAGLAISSRMTSQINGMDQAVRNANDGISMSQTAESALSSASDILQRVRELAVQSSNSSNSASDRQAIQSEVSQLSSELDRIATTTQFNGQNLLDGTGGTLNYQVGANAGQSISTSTANYRTSNYGDNRVSTSGVDATATTSNAVTAGTITIAGYLGSEDIDVAQYDSAESIATAINAKSADTGVTATAKTTTNLQLTAGSSYSFEILSDNSDAVSVSFTYSGTTAAGTSDDYSSAITAINAVTSKTGVTAEYDTTNGGIKLTNSTGEDITITNDASSGAISQSAYLEQGQDDGSGGTLATATTLAAGAGSSTATGTITLDSQNSFQVTQDGSGLGLMTGSTTGASDLKSVAELDVTTYDNAQLAIAIVDSALASVNNQLANYGAVQNRFTSVVSNLQSSSQNLSSSRSQIQDADYATETSNMTKANILQQAGTTVLAQANSSQQNVLTLLK